MDTVAFTVLTSLPTSYLAQWKRADAHAVCFPFGSFGSLSLSVRFPVQLVIRSVFASLIAFRGRVALCPRDP